KLKENYYPNGNEKFRIEIKGKGNYDRALFCVSFGKLIDPYKGKLTINEREKKGDLRINVQQMFKGTLIPKSKYITMCIAIIFLEVLIYVGVFYKMKRKVKK
ncbi:MAG: hypothetical protein ACI4HM_07645, partial [Ruminococcus sp.]